MANPSAVRGERRRHPRYTPDDVRVWVSTGEFEEKHTAVNFARRLVNVSLDGACVETTGRLRADVKLRVEMRFDDLRSSIRSEAKVIWVATESEGAYETNKAGLKFVGQVMIGKPVREYLRGASREMIDAQRKVEFSELKRSSEKRQDGARRKWGPGKKIAAALFILALLYTGSFWGLVFRGRIDGPGPEIAYRYLDPGPEASDTEELLAGIYDPLYRLFRMAGLPLEYRPDTPPPGDGSSP